MCINIVSVTQSELDCFGLAAKHEATREVCQLGGRQSTLKIRVLQREQLVFLEGEGSVGKWDSADLIKQRLVAL